MKRNRMYLIALAAAVCLLAAGCGKGSSENGAGDHGSSGNYGSGRAG